MSEQTTHDRCVTERILEPGRSEWALMGPAHAISGAGVTVLALGIAMNYAPEFLQYVLVGSAILGILFVAVSTGSALVPDLDNSRSTVNSSLGFVGAALSSVFRFTSKLLQSTIRTKRDDSNPDPHRGFWHTLVGAATLGAIAVGLSSISLKLFDVGDMPVTLGGVFYFGITATMIHLFLAGVAKKRISKLKKIPVVGEVVVLAISAAITGALLFFAPEGAILWLGVAIALGCSIHILGDALTTAGVPIFFPIIGLLRKKLWWKTRFAKFQADDKELNKNIHRLSIAMIVVGIGFAVYALVF